MNLTELNEFITPQAPKKINLSEPKEVIKRIQHCPIIIGIIYFNGHFGYQQTYK